MNIFKRACIRYILYRYPISHGLWLNVSGQLALLQGMSAVEKARLRELTSLFLYEKKFAGVQGLELTDAMRLSIATQACVPVLNLGLNCLSGWTEIIVYPGPFRISRNERDDAGIVHRREQELEGESWSRGPLILSWESVERGMQETRPDGNVIIHEIAHKLDMLNGPADGYPPLHQGMNLRQWTLSLGAAYKELVKRVEHHHDPCINPYAAASPGEFFAVISEYFFCAPEILHSYFPDVYRQLRFYYRQHPLQRSQSETD